MLKLTNHGVKRLFERVETKAQNKTIQRADEFLNKVLKKGITMANDAQQMLIVYANNLYIFKKLIGDTLLFITVKTSHQQKFDVYTKGKKRTPSIKKNFALCA